MSEPAMIAGPWRPVRRGVRGGITATGRGLALAGLATAQLGLLVLLFISPILIGLAIAILLADHGIGTRQQVVLALVLLAAGLVAGRLAAVPALLGLRNLARLTRRLLGDWAGIPVAEAYLPPPSPRAPFHERLYWLTSDPATRRDLAWSAVNATVGWLVAALPAIAVVGGFLGMASGLNRQFGSSSSAAFAAKPGSPSLPNPVAVQVHAGAQPLQIVVGLALVSLGVGAAPWVLRGYAGLARPLLAPPGQAELAQRVYHLTQTRSETIDSGAAEIRRIERDLHDGAQARLVAVGMTPGRGRGPDRHQPGRGPGPAGRGPHLLGPGPGRAAGPGPRHPPAGAGRPGPGRRDPGPGPGQRAQGGRDRRGARPSAAPGGVGRLLRRL
jgi:hypothetical protein